MYIYPYKAEQMLKEADSCILRMVQAKNLYEFRGSFVSFLNSARFSLQSFRVDYKDIPGFDQWWKERSTFLKDDELCIFFRNLRNDTIKAGVDPFIINQIIDGPTTIKGPVQIGPQGIFRGVIDKERIRWEPISIPGLTTKIFLPNIPTKFNNTKLDALCREYLGILNCVVDEFVKKFGNT